MWNGAGSVSPAGRACDWTGPCHCESCVARRGEVVPRKEDAWGTHPYFPLPRSPYVVPNELTHERATEIADLLQANEQLRLGREQLRMWETAVKIFEFRAELYAASVRSQIAVNSALMDLRR